MRQAIRHAPQHAIPAHSLWHFLLTTLHDVKNNTQMRMEFTVGIPCFICCWSHYRPLQALFMKTNGPKSMSTLGPSSLGLFASPEGHNPPCQTNQQRVPLDLGQKLERRCAASVNMRHLRAMRPLWCTAAPLRMPCGMHCLCIRYCIAPAHAMPPTAVGRRSLPLG